MAHGYSKCVAAPRGVRRVVEGKAVAPRSLRRKGKRWMTDCQPIELHRAGVISDNEYDAMVEDAERRKRHGG